MQRTKGGKLSDQIRRHAAASLKPAPEYDGNDGCWVSTGSTLLNLAIAGGRRRGGGLPGGILVEVFGPASCGKTVLLCEVAGAVQRHGGEVMFFDPEARLNKQYARLFDFDADAVDYIVPDTVTEVFAPVRAWMPKMSGLVHGVFADSLAALSTKAELADKDQFGMRRAKEFSEELRKTCRALTERNILMMCSNQVRENIGASQFEPHWRSPGGLAVGFYASLRLRCSNSRKIKRTKVIGGREHVRTVGVETTVEVYKSSVWQPYRTALLTILFDYGIDDVRQNLQYIKDNTGAKLYVASGKQLGISLDAACEAVEQAGMENALREEVISMWTAIERQFDQQRKPKERI